MRIISFWERNPDAAERLRVMWDDGLSTVDIGRRLGCGKNAVISKKRRMGLEDRPSPIRVAGSGTRKSRKLLCKAPRSVPLPSLFALLDDPIILTEPPRERPAPKPPAERAVFVKLPVGECHFPIGEPGSKAFRFCCELTEPGRPYCLDHCKAAYIDYRPRRAIEEMAT